MKVWVFAMSRVSLLDTGSPILVSPRWAAGVGVGGQTAVWAITAVITVFLVTPQANAMWKRLIHGSQVLNTATPPAAAVIPTPPPQVLWPPATSISVPTTGTPVWREGGRVQKEGRELWLPGGQRQDVGNKEIFLRTLFIPNQSPSSSHRAKAPKCFNQTSGWMELKWYD